MEMIVVPAEGLVALVDVAAYSPYLGPDWTLEGMSQHLATEMDRGVIFAWGVGESGNWRIEVARETSPVSGFRACAGRVQATTPLLHLTSYDELTAAAQFADVRLPRSGTEEWVVAVEPGWYDCRIVQLYDPELADTEEVFHQEAPHFRLELTPATEPGPRPNSAGAPWFGSS
jgi:hypothetical protein